MGKESRMAIEVKEVGSAGPYFLHKTADFGVVECLHLQAVSLAAVISPFHSITLAH